MSKPTWAGIKALTVPDPETVKQNPVNIVNTGTKDHPNWVAVTRRNKRRPVSGRLFHDVQYKSPKAARLTPVDADGRAASIIRNRLARRIARQAYVLRYDDGCWEHVDHNGDTLTVSRSAGHDRGHQPMLRHPNPTRTYLDELLAEEVA